MNDQRYKLAFCLILKMAASWAVFVFSLLAFFGVDWSFLPRWLGWCVVAMLGILAFVSLIASVYWTFLRPIVCLVRMQIRLWRRGRGLAAFGILASVAIGLCSFYQLFHWSRMPEYDCVSPDGKHKLVFYVNNYDLPSIFPGGPGDGLFHAARVDLVKTSLGVTIDSQYVDSLAEALNVSWFDDAVWVGRGDGCAQFKLKDGR